MSGGTSEKISRFAILKLLAGPQAGAEMPLSDGQYRVGSDDDNDLVLFDSFIAPRHFLLLILGKQIQVQADQQSLVINGTTLLEGETADISSGIVIELGTTQLAIGPIEGDWLNNILSRPIRNVTEPSVKEELHVSYPEASLLNEAERNIAYVEKHDETGYPAESSLSQKKGNFFGWAVGLAVIAGIFSLFYWKWYLDKTIPLPHVPTVEERVQKIVNELGLKNAVLTSNPEEETKIAVEGCCVTEQEKQQLNEKLKAMRLEIENRLLTTKELNEKLDKGLKRLGSYGLKYEYLDDGVVHLSGYSSVGLSSEELLAKLKDEIPHALHVEGEVYTLGDAVTSLRKKLRSVGLAQQVYVQSKGHIVVADGRVGPRQMALWEKTAQEFDNENHGTPGLESRVRLGRDFSNRGNTEGTSSSPTDTSSIQEQVVSSVSSPSKQNGVVRGFYGTTENTTYLVEDKGGYRRLAASYCHHKEGKILCDTEAFHYETGFSLTSPK